MKAFYTRYLFSNIGSGVMDHRKIYKIIVTFFYAICFIAFFIWLIQAIDNYQSLATSSKVSFKHGDDGTMVKRCQIIFWFFASFHRKLKII